MGENDRTRKKDSMQVVDTLQREKKTNSKSSENVRLINTLITSVAKIINVIVYLLHKLYKQPI